jgi:AraC-like DNA-binding protein
MERAAALPDYARAPTGRFLAGAGWLAYCHSPALWGFALAGAPRADAVEQLVAAVATELGPGVAPHASLVDVRGLDAVEPEAFAHFENYVRTHRTRLAERVTRLAVVCAPGLAGAAVAGFFGVMRAPFPVSVVEDVPAGLRFLGLSEATFEASLAVAVQALDEPVSLSVRVRVLLRRSPEAEAASMAAALGCSLRTLQRSLQAAGTSLRAEQAAVRLETALAQIAATDASLTRVALDAGYASVQHMGRAVRAATGRSPSAIRLARGDHPLARP